MKYGVQYGDGEYIYNGRSAAVVEFGTGSAVRAWVRDLPSRREEIPGRAYVTSAETLRSVRVTKAAISPDDLSQILTNRNMTRTNFLIDEQEDFSLGRSKRFGKR